MFFQPFTPYIWHITPAPFHNGVEQPHHHHYIVHLYIVAPRQLTRKVVKYAQLMHVHVLATLNLRHVIL